MLGLAIIVSIFTAIKGQPIQVPCIVAQDGSGNYTTISEAIRAAPNHSNWLYYINIKKGVYHETLRIGAEKTNIALVGEAKENTIITGSRSNASGFSLEDTATIGIEGGGFMAQSITFENAAGPEGNQSVAVHSSGTNLTFYNCRIMGYQDTLYATRGRQFFRECEIMGTVDFIFGNSAAVFQNCEIQARQPLPGQYITMTAQGRSLETEPTGLVLQNCTINASQELRKVKAEFRSFLGRPWKDFSRTVIMQSFIDDLIDPKGWIEWNGQTPVHPYFAEYQNNGPGANLSGRVNWSVAITTTMEASQFTLRTFLQGDTWIPSDVPRYLDLL